MGGSPPGPPADALICKYNKVSFNNKLNIIRDAHDVSNFYADILLSGNNLPLTFGEYKNYTDETEEYFNKTRKIILPDIGNSYSQVYQYIQNSLKNEYENPNNKDDDRRHIIDRLFKKCYNVQKYIIEDLWDSCNKYPASDGKIYIKQIPSWPSAPKQPEDTST